MASQCVIKTKEDIFFAEMFQLNGTEFSKVKIANLLIKIDHCKFLDVTESWFLVRTVLNELKIPT